VNQNLKEQYEIVAAADFYAVTLGQFVELFCQVLTWAGSWKRRAMS